MLLEYIAINVPIEAVTITRSDQTPHIPPKPRPKDPIGEVY